MSKRNSPPTIDMFPDDTPHGRVPKARDYVFKEGSVDMRILRYVQDQGGACRMLPDGGVIGGATAFEVDVALHLTGDSTASARIRMLVRAGRLRDSGFRRATTNSSTARVWEAVIPREAPVL